MALFIPKAALLLLAAWGFWTLWGFPYTNGLLGILKKLSAPGASIPGPTRSPMRQRWTGIKLIDAQTTNLVGFFYTAVDGNRPDVSLAGLDLGGQVVAAWVLFTTEGMRSGNQGKFLVTAITLLGMLLQQIGFACIAPIWMAIHLATSPTVVDPKDFNLLVRQPYKLAIAPISIALGYGIPSVIMSLPAPAKISFEQKQTWAGIQQLWPIWIAIIQVTLSIVVPTVDSMVVVQSEADKKQHTIKYLRRIYAFGVFSSFSGHAISWGISLLAYAFPILFNLKFVEALQPTNIFLPVVPFGPRQATTLADGALWFLQWDVAVGTSAVLLWALTLRISARHEPASPLEWVIGMAKVTVLATVLGPCGAAVVAVWGRDELVFRQAAAADAEIVSKKKTY